MSVRSFMKQWVNPIWHESEIGRQAVTEMEEALRDLIAQSNLDLLKDLQRWREGIVYNDNHTEYYIPEAVITREREQIEKEMKNG